MEIQDIRRIACIGTGLIGSSWAAFFLRKGFEVTVYDISDELLEVAEKRIHQILKFYVEQQVMEEAALTELMKKAQFTTKLTEAVKDVQFIQESGPESYEIKQQIIKEVERATSPETLFASSTSGLLMTEMAKHAQHPERILGAHPYNPPHLIPLVELSKGSNTSQENLKLAYDFYQSIGKVPVILQQETLGFIGNRLQAALYREAVDLVLQGVCTLEDVDKACLYGPGLRYGILGPNLIFHLGGGQAGIQGILENILGPSLERWLPDMAKWEKLPKDWPQQAAEGIRQAMQHRESEQGQTEEEIMKFRDNTLVELLKLHGKF